MTLITRYPALRTARPLAEDLFDSFFDSLRTYSEVSWSPRVNLKENKDGYVLYAELPGMDKNDIEISVEDDMISVSGEKKEEVKDREVSYLVTEIASGKFSRTFHLPSVIDADGISAKWENGILTVDIPKSEAAKPRKIKIS